MEDLKESKRLPSSFRAERGKGKKSRKNSNVVALPGKGYRIVVMLLAEETWSPLPELQKRQGRREWKRREKRERGKVKRNG